MRDFKKELDTSLNMACEFQSEKIGKLEFISDYIFDFTTYDANISIILSKKMLEVLKVIIDGTNFEYIGKDNNYINYITMCNTPFLSNKINWGTSIRGAWLDNTNSFSFDCDRIIVNKGELGEFIKQLIDWVK